MNVHIKFLKHGKGSAVHASAYVLDRLDHQGNVRAGVEVLRGDATAFNATCTANPHLWKYTSGVIAWSKEDNPTNQQIEDVLSEFEKHAFAGLDPSQYHLFAVLHIDDDGSKHIHVLTPRLDLQTGKALNIAPPSHETHFDALRDYLNIKHGWSRPDDLLLMKTTQEPNHIAKLNKQAKKMVSNQDLQDLPKKQFCNVIDNYVKTLLQTQIATDRKDIVECIRQLNDVENVKQSTNFLTVTLSNGKKHRLKGDFYTEEFEIRSFSEHLSAAAESRATASQLAESVRDAQKVRNRYRDKRAAYHSKQHAFKASTTNDNHSRIAPELDIERNQQSVPGAHSRDDRSLQRENRHTDERIIKYRYVSDSNRSATHQFIFNINREITDRNKPSIDEYQNRSSEFTEFNSKPSRASSRSQETTYREYRREFVKRQTQDTEELSHFDCNSDVFHIDAFNDWLSALSSIHQQQINRSTKQNHFRERSNHREPKSIYQQQKIEHEDRNRSVPDSTKQLTERTERTIAEANRETQRSRATITATDQEHLRRKQEATNVNIISQFGDIKNRASRLFSNTFSKLSNKLIESITSTVRTSFESTEFEKDCREISRQQNDADPRENRATTRAVNSGTLEDLTVQALRKLGNRVRESSETNDQAARYLEGLNHLNRRLDTLIKDGIKIEPKHASQFKHIRYDSYYPDAVTRHKSLSIEQDHAFERRDAVRLIEIISKKTENLLDYMRNAGNTRDIYPPHFELINKMRKNDRRMLKYLDCQLILEPQNEHLTVCIHEYKKCLDHFKKLENIYSAFKHPQPIEHEQPSIRVDKPLNEPKRQNENSFNIDGMDRP